MSRWFKIRETALGLVISRSICPGSGLHKRGLFFPFVHRTQQGLNALKTKGEFLAPLRKTALDVILWCQHVGMPIIHPENSRKVLEGPDAQGQLQSFHLLHTLQSGSVKSESLVLWPNEMS